MVHFLFPVLWITDLDTVHIVTYHQFFFSPKRIIAVYTFYIAVFFVTQRCCTADCCAVGARTGKTALDLEVLPAISLSN